MRFTVRHAVLGRCSAIALLAGFLAAAIAACGGGNDCSGVISVNVPADQCDSLGQQFGCSRVDTEGGRCGLFGCASCGALNPNQGM